MLFMRPGIPSPGLVSRAYHQQNPYTFPHCHPQNAFDVVRTLGDDADALKRDMGPQQSNYTDLILVVEFFCNCLYVERNNEGLQCSR
ncbi:hypothetical protein CISIN_1g044820mg [Citrus sinensis]|uniref:Uncharacterized protein n=1 Tax=Citrus sinensis TaxID=2711 RepID=A0A067F2X5_CITSI|nr:hypothetical protein CISIN_1g044820mg [Citrus sinensis]